MHRLCLTFLLLAGIASSAIAASPDPKTLAVPPGDLAKSRELVQQLGSDEFSEREEAEQALAKMGRLARTALLEAVNSDTNAEIRTRCESLLSKANYLELKARLEVFLADVDGKYNHDLPGWNQFRSTLCGTRTLFGCPISGDPALEKAARSVFVELISTPENKAVVMAAGGTQTELNAIAIGRRQELYNRRIGRVRGPGGFAAEPSGSREISAADVASLLFAETLAPQIAGRVPRGASMSVLITASSFSTHARDSDERGRVYKAIAAAWLDSRMNPLDMYQGLTLASQLGLPEQSFRISARMLTTPGATPLYKGNAATILRSGGREHIPLLEKALEDTSVLGQAQVRIRTNNDDDALPDIQVRDLALTIAIYLAGEKVEDYGFIDQVNGHNNLTTLKGGGAGYTSYTRYYIPDDKRAAAFEKWKVWWAKNRNKS